MMFHKRGTADNLDCDSKKLGQFAILLLENYAPRLETPLFKEQRKIFFACKLLDFSFCASLLLNCFSTKKNLAGKSVVLNHMNAPSVSILIVSIEPSIFLGKQTVFRSS